VSPPEDQAVGKSYDGPSGAGRDSQWLTWEDLPTGKDVTVTIEDVLLYTNVKFQGGRTKDRMLGLKFKGGSRILGLNATNRKCIAKQYGNTTGGWKGQKISLYVAQTQMAGETVNCVRIRERASKAVKDAQTFLDQPPSATTPGDLELDAAFSALGASDADRLILEQKFGGDREGLLRELSSLVDQKAAS
jgi:hypothetical protein